MFDQQIKKYQNIIRNLQRDIVAEKTKTSRLAKLNEGLQKRIVKLEKFRFY